jgi:hypothetical protein
MANLNSIFYYVEHAPMDMNLPSQDDTPFTLGIQTLWQTKTMKKYGHNSSVSFDATFGTNQRWVHFIHYFTSTIKFCTDITYLTIILNTTFLLFVVPLLHHDGLE